MRHAAISAVVALVIALGSAHAAQAAARHDNRALLQQSIVTTPSITKRCNKYANKHSGRGSSQLKDRRSVFLACVQRADRRGQRHESR